MSGYVTSECVFRLSLLWQWFNWPRRWANRGLQGGQTRAFHGCRDLAGPLAAVSAGEYWKWLRMIFPSYCATVALATVIRRTSGQSFGWGKFVKIARPILLAVLLLNPMLGLADAAEMYDRLKSLEGNWEAELPGFGKLTSTVRAVSTGKAIQEIIGTPAESELSVYTLSNETIALMHYCAMTPDGHQVLLQTDRLDAPTGELDFRFKSATNLHGKDAAHMRRMTLTIVDRDHYSEKWIKTEEGKDTTFELLFVRR